MRKYLLKDALKNHYAVGAFNFGSLEILKAIMMAGENKNAPIIAQVSEGAINFMGKDYLKGIIASARKLCTVPISFHLDHGKSFESVKEAIDMGCDSVMIDASMLPFEDNVQITKKVVDYAHARGIFVEAELGSIAGVEEDLNVSKKDSFYTSPQQAKEFVKRTKVDSLAVAIGTKHGAYKYSGEAKLRFDILGKIQKEIPNVPLVLHGASGVDPKRVKALYDLGVDITGAKGIPDKFIEQVSKMNICKINGDTDIRIAFLIGVLENIKNNNKNIDYRKYLSAGINAVCNLVSERIELYSSANRVK